MEYEDLYCGPCRWSVPLCLRGLRSRAELSSRAAANRCTQVFGFVLGQTYLPAGATCYCGGEAPLQETDCWCL